MKKIVTLFLVGFISILNAGNAKEYKKACNAGDVGKCIKLGLLYINGQKVKQNPFKAKGYFKKACDKGNAYGCYNVGIYYQRKGSDGDSKSYFEAKKYFKIACDGGYGRGCNNLGSLYYYGQGVRQDLIQAKKYYGKACDGDSADGCNNYAILNSQGY